MRIWSWQSSFSYIYQDYIKYPVYFNLTYVWNFGVLAFFFLVIQIISGIFLAMHYIPSADLAFISVEHIMRDIPYGWFLRYLHANGASFFFLSVYFHIFRNLYYFTYITPRELVWNIGIILFFLMILTAFLGYVLPWGQMSFRAATVITSLFSVFPIYGDDIVIWLWGSFSVSHITLTRFFSLHYFMPFIILLLVFLHILFLHETGSSNPAGLTLKFDKIWFFPYYSRKDIYVCLCFLLGFFLILIFLPNYLSHTDNYIPANPIVTPAHIVPEWYFLPFYALLRSIPNKVGGIIILLFTLGLLFCLPFITSNNWRENNSVLFYCILVELEEDVTQPKSERKIITKVEFQLIQCLCWFIGIVYILLGWLGGCPIEYPYILVGQSLTLILVVCLSLNNYIWWYSFQRLSLLSLKIKNVSL